jgi:hypothetical protein
VTLLLLDTTLLTDADLDGNAFDDLIGDDAGVAVAAIRSPN